MYALNDLKFKKYAILSISLLLVFNFSIILDYIGLNIIFLRQISGFFFLTFLPGYTILRILRIHKFGDIKAFLFSVGISIFLVMITGFLINIIYPFFGNLQPITLVPTLIIFDLIFLLLLLLAYLRDKKWNGYDKTGLHLNNIVTPRFLALSILPFLSILGAYFSNYYNIGNNFIFFLIFLLSLSPIIFFLTKNKNYVFFLWIFAISLILIYDFNPSFNFLWGNDIIHENYLANLVINNGIWNTNLNAATNSMLSIVMVNPIYSIFLGMDSVLIFKLIYLFIFSLIPIILFTTYNKFLNKFESFITVLFFMVYATFFTEMLNVARQQIAELFLALLLLLLIEDNLNNRMKKFFFLIFGFALIISHYGTTWLFLASLIIGFFLIKILKIKDLNIYLFKINFIIIFTILSLTWYIYMAASSAIIGVVDIGKNIVGSISELFQPTQGTMMITSSVAGLHIIGRYITYINLALIIIGVLFLFINYKKTKINKEFLILIFIWFFFDIAGMVVPNFGSALNVTRIFQLSLLFISPCFIIGVKTVFHFGSKFSKLRFFNKEEKLHKLLILYIVIIFLFSSGLLYSVTNSPPYNWYIDERSNAGPKWVESEFNSANWLKSNSNSNFTIYADVDNAPIFRMFYLNVDEYVAIAKTANDKFNPPFYLFLSGKRNIIDKEFQILPSGYGSITTIPLDNLEYYKLHFSQMNKLYDNSLTAIYRSGSL